MSYKAAITLFGANGMLGRYVQKYLSQQGHYVRGLTRKDIDVGTVTQHTLEYYIDKGVDVVVNCAGIIPQRTDVFIEEMIKVNSIFPHALAKACNQADVRLIHITTDCVFDGKGGRYSEFFAHNALGNYGRTKSLGEPYDCTIIRTSTIGEKENDPTSLLEWFKSQSGNRAYGYSNHFWNGVTSLQLAKVIEQIISEKLYWEGVRHIHSPDWMSKDSLLRELNHCYDLGAKIVSTNIFAAIDRRLFTNYSKELELFKIPPIVTQIKEQKEFGCE